MISIARILARVSATWVTGLVIGLGMLMGCASDGPGAKRDAAASPAVAELDGETITLDELETWMKEDAWRRETEGKNSAQLYEIRATGLDQMLNERILESAAAAKGITPDELLDGEIEAAGGVSEAEIAAFFEANQGSIRGGTLEQLAPRIERHLESQLARNVMLQLRESAGAKVLLEQPRADVAATGPSLGPADAPVTIVEFSDFQCPFCQRVGPTLRELRERYPTQVRIVYRHMPLERIHARAKPAAEASACADDQGQFWAFHDKIFEIESSLSDDDLTGFAAAIGLDLDVYGECVTSGKHRALVESDMQAGRELGVTGTPAFFVNGLMLTGAQPVDAFAETIDAELARLN